MEKKGCETMDIRVVLTPGDPLPGDRDGWLVVDLLRATSQIATFFDGGGQVLLPVETLEEARSLKERLGAGWLLMGERESLPPEGFDAGNSPLELLRLPQKARLRGVLTTTNGTRALLTALASGGRVFASCARNARSAARAVRETGDRLGILCAGLKGGLSWEDGLCAGLLVERLLEEEPRGATLDEGAELVRRAYRAGAGDFASGVLASEHARRLLDLGLGGDVAFCCEVDAGVSVPELTRWEGLPAFTG